MTLQTKNPAGSARKAAGEGTWAGLRDAAERAYADALRENARAEGEAVSRAGETAQQRREETAAAYRGLDRQLYRDYMAEQKALPQALAARGYTGGVSESGRLRLRNGYEEALAENTRARIAAQAGIEADRRAEELRARQTARAADEKARERRDAALSDLAVRQHSDDLSRARELAGAGDYSGYRALGYSEEEIAYLSRIWAARNPSLRGEWSYGHYR